MSDNVRFLDANTIIWLATLKVGDLVGRNLGGAALMLLKVTAITDDLIVCGAWTFDIRTGDEVDDDLRWGPKYGITGSYLLPPDNVLPGIMERVDGAERSN